MEMCRWLMKARSLRVVYRELHFQHLKQQELLVRLQLVVILLKNVSLPVVQVT